MRHALQVILHNRLSGLHGFFWLGFKGAGVVAKHLLVFLLSCQPSSSVSTFICNNSFVAM